MNNGILEGCFDLFGTVDVKYDSHFMARHHDTGTQCLPLIWGGSCGVEMTTCDLHTQIISIRWQLYFYREGSLWPLLSGMHSDTKEVLYQSGVIRV